MIEFFNRLSDPSVKLGVVFCVVVLAVDITVRIAPKPVQQELSLASGDADVFARRAPSERWLAWSDGVKKVRAQKAQKALEDRQKAEAEKVASEALLSTRPPFEDKQKGNLQSLRVGEFDYRLWGVFTKSNPDSADDLFGVLKSTGGALQVRHGDALGAYKVIALAHRSVRFESTIDERVVTLWLFGKGPR